MVDFCAQYRPRSNRRRLQVSTGLKFERCSFGGLCSTPHHTPTTPDSSLLYTTTASIPLYRDGFAKSRPWKIGQISKSSKDTQEKGKTGWSETECLHGGWEGVPDRGIGWPGVFLWWTVGQVFCVWKENRRSEKILPEVNGFLASASASAGFCKASTYTLPRHPIYPLLSSPLPLLPPTSPHPLPLPLPRHVQFTSFLRVSLVGGETWARSGKGVLTPDEMKGNWNQGFELEGSETRGRVGRMHPHQIAHTPLDFF